MRPGVSRGIPRAEVTRTDVTRAVPVDVMKARAARAFAADVDEPHEPGAPPSVGPATRRATPAALQHPPPGPDDFEVATEVRPPQFTPAAPVEQSGASLPASAPPATAPAPTQPLPQVLASKPHAATLRSSSGLAEGAQVQAILRAPDPHERTRPMPGAPPRPVLPTITDSAPPPSRPQQASPVSAPLSAAIPRTRMTPRVVALMTVGGAVSLLALGLLGWLVSNLLAR